MKARPARCGSLPATVNWSSPVRRAACRLDLFEVVQLWQLDSGRVEFRQDRFDWITLTPDGARVVSVKTTGRPPAEVNLVEVRTIANGRVVMSAMQREWLGVVVDRTASYSLDGRRVAIGYGDGFKLFDGVTGRLLMTVLWGADQQLHLPIGDPAAGAKRSALGRSAVAWVRLDDAATRITVGTTNGRVRVFEGDDRMEAALLIAESHAGVAGGLEGSVDQALETVRSDKRLSPAVRDEAIKRLEAFRDRDPRPGSMGGGRGRD